VHGLKLQPKALESESRDAVKTSALVSKSRGTADFLPHGYLPGAGDNGGLPGFNGDQPGGTVINICHTPWADVEQTEELKDMAALMMHYHAAPLLESYAGAAAYSNGCGQWCAQTQAATHSPLSDQFHADFQSPFKSPMNYFSCQNIYWKSQAYVGSVIHNWQTGHYGGSWVIPSWMLACAGSHANGDPHVVNIRGEKFDIASQGEVELIHYPQGAENSSAKLIIMASIDKLGSGCHDTYIKGIKISGTWLKEIVSFKDDEDTGDILVTSSNVSKPVEWARMHGSEAEKFQGEQIHFESRTRASFQIARGTKLIVYSTGRVHKGVGTYLNVELQGFTQLEGAVGGLLGLDSHQKEVDMAKDMCKKSRVAKARAFHQKTDALPEGSRNFHIRIN